MDAGATVTIVGMGELGVQDDEYDVRLIAPPRVSNAPIRIQRVLANVSASFRFQRLMLDTAREVGADVYHCNDLDTSGRALAQLGIVTLPSYTTRMSCIWRMRG